jgi:hypothetical protein
MLGGEGLVQLDEPDVVNAQAETREQLLRGRHRPVAHDPRIDAGAGRAEPAQLGPEAEFVRLVPAREQERRGAVVDAAGIAGGHRAALAEGGLEFRHVLERGRELEPAVLALAAARMLVPLDPDGLAPAPGYGDGDDLVREPAGVHGRDGAAMAFDGEGVLLLARDLHLLGDVLRRLAQADDGIHRVHPRVVKAPADRGVPHLRMPHLGRALRLRHGPGRPAHGFDTAADEDIALLGDDRLGRLIDRLERRGAVAVDRDAGHFLREASEQHRHARDIAVVLARLIAAAGVDVIERGRGDTGSRHQGLIDIGQEIVRAHRGQRAAEFSYGAAYPVDNDDFLHDDSW